MLNEYALLIPGLSWLAAIFIVLSYLFFNNQGERGEKFTAGIAFYGLLASNLLVLAIGINSLYLQAVPGDITYLKWLSLGDININISLKLDLPGLLVLTLFSLLLMITVRFSKDYMHREPGFQRFFFILCLFSGAMQLLTIAGNATLTFLAWEFAGVSSYLLIGYFFDRKTATKNANRVFVTNRIGDAGFMLGLIVSFSLLSSSEWNDINSAHKEMSDIATTLLALGFVLAALVKSAQLPFSAWITQALEGPTPSSAIFYGSLIIHAGAFLLIRMQPLLEQIPVLLIFITIIGALTAIYGYLVGLSQTDVKSGLIFSTISQVGIIFVLIGLDQFELATYYLIAHAIWRTYQFLHAPSMMHWMDRPMKQVPAVLQKNEALYTVSQQRFWLDPMSDRIFTRPVYALSRDLRYFDDHIVNKLVGLPSSVSAVSTLAQWDAYHSDQKAHIVADSGMIGRGQGLAGTILDWISRPLFWIENHLVLKTGDEGVQRLLQHFSRYISTMDNLLSQPRYLWLIIFIVFIIAV